MKNQTIKNAGVKSSRSSRKSSWPNELELKSMRLPAKYESQIKDYVRTLISADDDSTETSFKTQSTPRKIKSTTRRAPGNYTLTDEQAHAVDLALNGNSLKIEAFAGSGKTTNLKAIGQAKKDSRGLYLAFNKTIQIDAAKSFSNNVVCKTAHSLAFGAVGRLYAHRLKPLYGRQVSQILNISGVDFITGVGLGNFVIDTIQHFCHSADEEITDCHVPHDAKLLEKKKSIAIVDSILAYARQLFTIQSDVNGTVPITHDTYLKLWQLSSPKLRYDFILFDECQDANGVMLDIVEKQEFQKIYVGDRFQQIYSWRGAKNAMDLIRTDNTCSITQSFRFGQEIADIANTVLNKFLDAKVSIKGYDKVHQNNKRAVLFRTNGAMLSHVLALMEDGKNVYVAGGTNQIVSLLKGIDELYEKGRTSHRELMIFENYGELKEYSKTDTGSSYKTIINCYEQYDVDELVTDLALTVTEKVADVTVSTAHKAKGKEWMHVTLADDFRHPGKKNYDDEEANLLYVATTRAQIDLDYGGCESVLEALKEDDKPIDNE